MLYDITKIQKYGKGLFQSEKIGLQWYFIVNARVYTDETKSAFWRVRFLIMFDFEDIAEYFELSENEGATPELIKEYKNIIAENFAYDLIETRKNIDDVCDACNKNIKRYA